MDSSIRRCRDCGGEFFVAADGFPASCPHCGSPEIAWSSLSRPGDPDLLGGGDIFPGAVGSFDDLYF
jgi:predicted RNA-binding Zn-ribbon protein involved in translation (DUF1610 family)